MEGGCPEERAPLRPASIYFPCMFISQVVFFGRGGPRWALSLRMPRPPNLGGPLHACDHLYPFDLHVPSNWRVVCQQTTCEWAILHTRGWAPSACHRDNPLLLLLNANYQKVTFSTLESFLSVTSDLTVKLEIGSCKA